MGKGWVLSQSRKQTHGDSECEIALPRGTNAAYTWFPLQYGVWYEASNSPVLVTKITKPCDYYRYTLTNKMNLPFVD